MASSDRIKAATAEERNAECAVYEPDDHPIRKSEIDEDARKIVHRLQRAGFKAYVVGGGVRDLVIGKKPKDFDISTNATPREIKSLFRNCRIIGRRFKLAHIFFGQGKTIEVSTFRDLVEWSEPVEGDQGEAPQPSPVTSDNIYGTESTDAVRRDITINGLFLDVATMQIIDYVGGMEDLQRGVVRVIGVPELRFKEDPVRMLRVVRHAARNGFSIEPSCWSAILEHSSWLTQCSQVRVFDEIKKDFCSGCFLTILSLLGDTGLLEYILPELLENNARLLSAESDFSQCLEKIDDLVLSGESVSSTVVLTIVALFIAGDSIWLKDLAETVPEASDLGERLSACFTRLVVPRKEREKIQMLLSLWSRVRSTPVRALKPGSYRRSSLLPELITLLEVSCMTREDAQRLNMLMPLLDDEDAVHHEPEPRRPAMGRRRR